MNIVSNSDIFHLASRAKHNVYDWLCFICTIFSTTTLLYSIINQYIPINRVLGFILLVLTGIIYSRSLKKKDLIILWISTTLFIISLIVPRNSSSGYANNAIYWYSTILILQKLSDEKCHEELSQAFNRNKAFIRTVLILNGIIILVGFFNNSSCYNNVWGEKYYVGFAYSNHVLSCGCCMSMCLALFLMEDIKSDAKKFVIMLPFVMAVLESGARTYLVSIVIIFFLIYSLFIKKFNSKVLLPPIVIATSLYLFLNSGLMDKFLDPNSMSKWTGVALFTNGRTVFWSIDIKAYLESSPFRILFGNGFGYSYYTNHVLYGRKIWAHNDFLESLMSVGILGLGVYLYVVTRFFMNLKRKARWSTYLCLVGYYFFVAFVNGLFIYQHYLYSFIILSSLIEYESLKKTECVEKEKVIRYR